MAVGYPEPKPETNRCGVWAPSDDGTVCRICGADYNFHVESWNLREYGQTTVPAPKELK